ncbi:YihY/virulence factor BrkB family protein [Actinotalea sp. K2]|uniref:YihY/virulence factor BrkB family protein n=1 Tax=Actinotalea sp. K2 TaxID=2939438 RepID=UPI002016FE4C|nr:YihY/virulence factor BrkB family protein [Actinotalea sp. K2]MCL3860502.1 YihY/virulence factor BrkB family protein [Actinotalea sp. K2]
MGDPHESRYPGAHSTRPSGIPARGWWQILVRAIRRSGADRVPLIAAGVAFFGFLALFPSLIAAVLVYGLVANPEEINRHVSALSAILPQQGLDLVTDQLESLTATDRQGLSLGLALSVVIALVSASIGVAHLITAVNLAYEETERVGFLKRRAMALLFTLGSVVVVSVLLALAGVVPLLLGGSDAGRLTINLGRWVVILAVSVLALGIIYRHGPQRRAARVPWVSVGAVVATAIWLLASGGFSLYVSVLGRYAETYGALAGVVVLQIWMWLTSMAVLFGAEINAEAEHQTDADTTVGPDRPRGARGAVKADTAVGRPTPDTQA